MKTKNKKKATTITVMLLVFAMTLLTGCSGNDDVNLFNQKKYATDYPIEIRDYAKDVYEGWDVWKRQEQNLIFLQITNRNYDKAEQIDRLLFWVFDSPEEAKNYYDSLYKRSKEYDRDCYWEEGDSWFISQEPDVCDAGIVWMNYQTGNIIIMAELYSWSEWAVYDDGTGTVNEPEGTTEKEFDEYNLKSYIIENAPEIRSFVLEKILGA